MEGPRFFFCGAFVLKKLYSASNGLTKTGSIFEFYSEEKFIVRSVLYFYELNS